MSLLLRSQSRILKNSNCILKPKLSCFKFKSSLSIWNVTNGRIIKKLDLDTNQMTLECFAGEFLFVLSKLNQTNGYEYDLHLHKFSFKFEVNF